MKNNFFISVVIPTYNRSKYLLKILDILKSNSINFHRFEVIICDSFSKDHTKTKINTLRRKTPTKTKTALSTRRKTKSRR